MNWKRILRNTLAAVVVPYATVFILVNWVRPVEYIRCDLYTEEMNGGLKTFKGRPYKIVLCGFQGRIEPENVPDDEIRLQVFSAEGELLAQRYFEPLFGMSRFSYELEYGPDYLIYNDGEGSGLQTRMAMPPGRLDWIRARLPRFVPLIFWPR